MSSFDSTRKYLHHAADDLDFALRHARKYDLRDDYQERIQKAHDDVAALVRQLEAGLKQQPA